MDILLTGGSGFIGRNLVQRWRHHRLYALGRSRVEGAIHIPCDLESAVPTALLPERLDAVIHLATAQTTPKAVFRVNAAATLDLLEGARARGARRFVLASTGTVYGWRDVDSDEATVPAPPDLYSASKLMAEHLVAAYRDHLDTTIFRLYMPYGRGQRTRLFADLERRVREGRSIVLVNGGAPILNPIHIDDVLDVFDHSLTAPGHALLNVGGTQALSIRDMAEAIARELDVRATFETKDRPGEPTRLVGRIDRLEQWLGHAPRITFAEGVLRTLRTERSVP